MLKIKLKVILSLASLHKGISSSDLFTEWYTGKETDL